MLLDGRRILIIGGTGSMGSMLTRRILSGRHGHPARVVVFSRDEAKQHDLRVALVNEAAGRNGDAWGSPEFVIGDVRHLASLTSACRDVDVVINAAALKQVPSCEYFPYEAVLTNVVGAQNLVRAIEDHALPVRLVVGVSTDKACKPVNTMGMTKAIQERILVAANLRSRGTSYLCVRYGNVLASRGSVIPLFRDQIRRGGPVTITTTEMTRFLLSLDDAVDTVMAAIEHGLPGETWVPTATSARVVDIARAMIGEREVDIEVVGIRPGEKVHESLISDEEAMRTVHRAGYWVIRPALPELGAGSIEPERIGEFVSDEHLLDAQGVAALLAANDLLLDEPALGAAPRP